MIAMHGCMHNTLYLSHPHSYLPTFYHSLCSTPPFLQDTQSLSVLTLFPQLTFSLVRLDHFPSWRHVSVVRQCFVTS